MEAMPLDQEAQQENGYNTQQRHDHECLDAGTEHETVRHIHPNGDGELGLAREADQGLEDAALIVGDLGDTGYAQSQSRRGQDDLPKETHNVRTIKLRRIFLLQRDRHED